MILDRPVQWKKNSLKIGLVIISAQEAIPGQTHTPSRKRFHQPTAISEARCVLENAALYRDSATNLPNANHGDREGIAILLPQCFQKRMGKFFEAMKKRDALWFSRHFIESTGNK